MKPRVRQGHRTFLFLCDYYFAMERANLVNNTKKLRLRSQFVILNVEAKSHALFGFKGHNL